jgi:hypothetical protein
VFSSKIQNIKIYYSVNYINTKTLNKAKKQKKKKKKTLLKKDKTSICTNTTTIEQYHIKRRQLKSHLDTNSSVTATNTNPCTQTNQGCMRLGWDGAKLCFYLLVSFENCWIFHSHEKVYSITRDHLMTVL